MTISSPLEAHKSTTLIYHIVGVDVGFENPMFACLEVDYEEADNDITGEVKTIIHVISQTTVLFGNYDAFVLFNDVNKSMLILLIFIRWRKKSNKP